MLCQQELSPHMYGIEECSRGVTCTYVPSACLHSSHMHVCIIFIYIYIAPCRVAWCIYAILSCD